MPTDEKQHIHQETASATDESHPNPEFSNPERISEAESHITTQVADLRAQLRHALEALPGIHEDRDTVQELEEIKAEINRIENSFLPRVLKFFSSPKESIQEWNEKRREKALAIADNPKIIRELQMRLQVIGEAYKKERVKHKLPLDQQKNSYSETSDIYSENFPLQDITSLVATFKKARKEKARLWTPVEATLEKVVFARVKSLIEYIGLDGQYGREVPEEEKVRGLKEAIELVDVLPESAQETLKFIYTAINIYFNKKWTIIVEDLRSQGVSEEDIYRKPQPRREQFKKERLNFLKDFPEFYAYYAIDLYGYGPQQRVGSYGDQISALQGLQKKDDRLSIVAEFTIESRKEGLKKGDIDEKTRKQLFEAYLKCKPEKLLDNIDFFQKEFDALSPALRKSLLSGHNVIFYLRENPAILQKIVAFIHLSSAEYTSLVEGVFKRSGDPNFVLQKFSQDPLTLLTNGHLFEVSLEDRASIIKKQLDSISPNSSLLEYKRRIDLLHQIIDQKEKYPYVDIQKAEEALVRLGRSVMEKTEIVPDELLDGDVNLTHEIVIEKGKILTLAHLLETKNLKLEDIDELKKLFFLNSPSVETITIVAERARGQFHDRPPYYRTESTSEIISFFKEFLDVDIEKHSDFNELRIQIYQKLMEKGNLKIGLEVYVRAHRKDLDTLKATCTQEHWDNFISRVLAQGDAATLHTFFQTIWTEKEHYFDALHTPERTQEVARAFLARGSSAEIGWLAKEVKEKNIDTFSDQEREKLRQKIIAEGDGVALLSYLTEGLMDGQDTVEKRKMARESFLQKASPPTIVELFCKEKFPSVLFEEGDFEILLQKVLASGSEHLFYTILTSEIFDESKKREVVDALLLVISPNLVTVVLEDQKLKKYLDRPEDIRKCINIIKEKGASHQILELLCVIDISTMTEAEYEEAIREAKKDGLILRGTQFENRIPKDERLVLSPEEQNELFDLAIDRDTSRILQGVDTRGPFSMFFKHEVLYRERVKFFIKDPSRSMNWSMVKKLPLGFVFQNRDFFAQRAELLRQDGLVTLADAIKRCSLSDSLEALAVVWEELISLIEKMAQAQEKLSKPEFNEFLPEDKTQTVNVVLNAQEAVSNKNLRLRLYNNFLENPAVFSRSLLAALPKESHASLPALKGTFGLNDEQVAQFAGEFFVGQVVKKSTDRDRFNYFLLEGEKNSGEVKSFLLESLPLMQRCSDSKKRLFSVSQLLRSYGFLENGYGERLTAVNTRLHDMNKEYDTFLDSKRADWRKPLEEELSLLEQTEVSETEAKKIKQKIEKKRTQIARGPEVKDETNWKKEFHTTVLKELDTLIGEYTNALPALFAERCGVDLTAEEVNKFLEKFKDPALLFIYLGKLQEFPAQQKLFRHFIESVAKGKFLQVRYEHREHLDKVFNGDARLEKLWRMNSRLERKTDGTVESEGVGKEAMAKQRIKEFITEALRHNHVEEGEYAEVMTAYMDTDDLARQGMKKDLENKIKNLVPDQDRTSEEKIWIAILNTMKLLSAKASQLKEGVIKEKQGTEAKEVNIEDLLKEIKNAFSAESPFQVDIAAISQVVGELKNEKKSTVNALKGLRAEESEDPDLLLRLGTDVIGSCQNVNSTPSLNQNLISYIMDGKIKTLFVRDGAGDIVSRAIMRILYDETAKKPVINLERSYHRSDAPVITSNELLFTLAQEKATKLGVDLTISGKFQSNRELNHYEGTLQSYGGPGDTEYVDTSIDAMGGSRKEQKYTIPGSSVFLVPEGKADVQLDSMPNYTWQSKAA